MADRYYRYRGLLRCTAVHCTVGQYGNLEKDALRDTKPVKTGERVRDMFRATDSEVQPCCCVLDRLKSPDQVGR